MVKHSSSKAPKERKPKKDRTPIDINLNFTNDEMNNINNQLNHYICPNAITNSSLYNSSELDPNGIRYNNWFKLHYKISKYIPQITIEGFKLLLTLVCLPQTQNKEFVKITIKELMIVLNVSDSRPIKEQLKLLLNNKFIYIKDFKDDINLNVAIDILILY